MSGGARVVTTEQIHAPTTHDEALAELLEANRQAKRQPHVMGTEDYPSRWDQWHEWIDLLLDDVRGAS